MTADLADRTDPPTDPPRLRVVLVDDELAANRWLAELLSRHDHVQVVGRARTADRAEALIARVRPDVVFIDVEMPGRDGLSVLDRLDPSIRGVIVTAFEEYAVEAFETPAVDYLLKPVTAARLNRTLARLAGGGPRQESAAPAVPADERITLPLAGETAVIPASTILWIESRVNYSVVNLIGREPLTVRRPLVQWDRDLPAASFQRVSRSLIVGLGHIAMIRWQWRGGTQIEFAGSDAVLTLGRAATRRLKERIDGSRRNAPPGRRETPPRRSPRRRVSADRPRPRHGSA